MQGEPGSGDGHTGDVVQLARALIATPSVNPSLEAGGAGEQAIAALVAGWLEAWGFRVDLVEAAPGRPSVVARLERGAGRSLILSGHLDTVGVAGMRIPPFGAETRDGRIWGRGACDMKGGVAAALAAARDAARNGVSGTLIVALTADEEEAALGCQRLVADGLSADAAVVCEPTNLALMPAHKGFAWVGVEFRGQAAHGSRPERGVDAIRHAGLFLARLDEIEATLVRRKRHPLLGHGSIHAGTISGGTAPSVYPSECRLVLERRTLPGEGASAIQSEIDYLLAQLRSHVSSLDAESEVVLHRDGSEIPPDHDLVRALAEAVESAGLAPRVEGMTAWVEAEFFNHSGTPTLCFGPGRIADAHSSDESVAIEDVELAYRVLSTFVGRYLS
jgi:acetylornithine deacetylase